MHEDESCQYPISFSGEEKFKLFVIATGSAPTQLTFRADSATAAIVPLKGSRATHLLLQSTEAAIPENTSLLFFLVINVAIKERVNFEYNYMEFLAPGLIIMTIIIFCYYNSLEQVFVYFRRQIRILHVQICISVTWYVI